MPSVALGIVVEGAYDTAVFNALIERIYEGEVHIVRSIEARAPVG